MSDLELALRRVRVPEDWRDESKQPNCAVCGSFAAKAREEDGTFSHWYLRCLVYDYWQGIYEHD